jgi:hypothetical protein
MMALSTGNKRTKYRWGNDAPAARARQVDPKIERELGQVVGRLAESIRSGILAMGLDIGTVEDRRGALNGLRDALYEKAEALAYADLDQRLRRMDLLDPWADYAETLGLNWEVMDFANTALRRRFETFVLGILDDLKVQGGPASAALAVREAAREAGVSEAVIDAAGTSLSNPDGAAERTE